MAYSPELLPLPPADPAEAAQRIASARRASGLTQRELADRLGISLWNVTRLESAQLTIDQLPPASRAKLAEVLPASLQAAPAPGMVPELPASATSPGIAMRRRSLAPAPAEPRRPMPSAFPGPQPAPRSPMPETPAPPAPSAPGPVAGVPAPAPHEPVAEAAPSAPGPVAQAPAPPAAEAVVPPAPLAPEPVAQTPAPPAPEPVAAPPAPRPVLPEPAVVEVVPEPPAVATPTTVLADPAAVQTAGIPARTERRKVLRRRYAPVPPTQRRPSRLTGTRRLPLVVAAAVAVLAVVGIASLLGGEEGTRSTTQTGAVSAGVQPTATAAVETPAVAEPDPAAELTARDAERDRQLAALRTDLREARAAERRRLAAAASAESVEPSATAVPTATPVPAGTPAAQQPPQQDKRKPQRQTRPQKPAEPEPEPSSGEPGRTPPTEFSAP